MAGALRPAPGGWSAAGDDRGGLGARRGQRRSTGTTSNSPQLLEAALRHTAAAALPAEARVERTHGGGGAAAAGHGPGCGDRAAAGAQGQRRPRCCAASVVRPRMDALRSLLQRDRTAG
ncbi:hypothetical protein QJS66_09360 [Kocuria rhizophila]|nr:hypothetical protein QJS66_09360 [Kocuria rhizophila]